MPWVFTSPPLFPFSLLLVHWGYKDILLISPRVRFPTTKLVPWNTVHHLHRLQIHHKRGKGRLGLPRTRRFKFCLSCRTTQPALRRTPSTGRIFWGVWPESRTTTRKATYKVALVALKETTRFNDSITPAPVAFHPSYHCLPALRMNKDDSGVT